MVQEIFLGDLTYWLVPLGQSEPPPSIDPLHMDFSFYSRRDFNTLGDALLFLRPLAIDELLMQDFRRLAWSMGLSKSHGRKDGEVLRYLAQEIAVHRLKVVQRRIPRSGTASDDSQESAARAASGPAAATRSDKVNEPDPHTFSPDVLQDQQAGALIAAAADGVPFCEECARRAAQAAA